MNSMLRPSLRRFLCAGMLLLLSAGCEKSATPTEAKQSEPKVAGVDVVGAWITPAFSRILILNPDKTFGFYAKDEKPLAGGFGYSFRSGQFLVLSGETLQLSTDAGALTLKIAQAPGLPPKLVLTETMGAAIAQQEFSRTKPLAAANMLSPVQSHLLPGASGKVMFMPDQAEGLEIHYSADGASDTLSAYKINAQGKPALSLHFFEGENKTACALFSSPTEKRAYLTGISRDAAAGVLCAFPAPATSDTPAGGSPSRRYAFGSVSNLLSISEVRSN